MTLKEHLTELICSLEQYEKRMGLPRVPTKHLAGAYIDLPIESYKEMDDEKLAEINCVLASYATFLQREINKKTAYMNWFIDLLNKTIAQDADKYGKFYHRDERVYAVITNNDFANNINNYMVKLQSQIDELSWLPQRINTLGKRIESLLFARRKPHD